MTLRVVSKRKGGTPISEGETPVEICRPSLLQNDDVLVYESQRAQCVAEHDVRFQRQYREDRFIRKEIDSLAARVRSGERIALVCWCAPKQCHGDNYVRKIFEINSRKKPRDISEEEI